MTRGNFDKCHSQIDPSDLLLKIRDNFNDSVWTTRTMAPYQGTRSPAFTGPMNKIQQRPIRKNFKKESFWTARAPQTMGPYQGTPSPAFSKPGDMLLKIRDNFNETVWTTRTHPTMGPYQGTRSPAFTGPMSIGMWKNETQLPIRKRDNVVVL